MLELNEQPIEEFNKLIDKYIKKDKINHAYLIETNYGDRVEVAKRLIDKILSFESNKTADDLIKNNDLRIIKTNQQVIKKEEIIALKEEFKTTSIYNYKRIYIIEEAEKLNVSSANTLLKFLEEPEKDIIAILITSNRNIVIDTIVSRCQIIRYYIKEQLSDNANDELNNRLFDFVITIEQEKEKAIAYTNKFLTKENLDRAGIKKTLDSLLYIYSDVLHNKVGLKLEYYHEYEDKIKQIAEYNEIGTIKNKINAINTCINRLKYNPNIKLLIDKLIILMSGVDINV